MVIWVFPESWKCRDSLLDAGALDICMCAKSHTPTLYHSYCNLAGQPLRQMASMFSQVSEVCMHRFTTAPGVYAAAKLDLGVAGLDGQVLQPQAGLALGLQVWRMPTTIRIFPRLCCNRAQPNNQHGQYVFSLE